MDSHSAHGLTYPYGEPKLTGIIKAQAQDFRVFEELGFTPSGQGEHLFIQVQKTDLTTFNLIELIAADVGIHPRYIGYSGLKDKLAVTRQWLSLHLPGMKTLPSFSEHGQYQVLDAQWHDKKLRVGTHRTNRFEIMIRNLTGQSDDFAKKVAQIQQFGFANYFGQQRFGQRQDNVSQALRILNNRHKAKRLSRTKKSLYISALRSELFNQVLAARIKQGIWKAPLDGDVFMLAGTRSVFQESLNEALLQRYREMDIHCGLSLVGIGESQVKGRAREIEDSVHKENDEIVFTLHNQGSKQDMRAHRSAAQLLQFSIEADPNTLQLSVQLARGCYLTTLLDHFIKTATP